MQKKIASKISAGVLSALLVLQGMFPTVSVMADEISETKPSETVIEETVTESSEETKASEETTASVRRWMNPAFTAEASRLLLPCPRPSVRSSGAIPSSLVQRSTSLMLLIQKLSVTSFQTCHLLTALSFRQHLI